MHDAIIRVLFLCYVSHYSLNKPDIAMFMSDEYDELSQGSLLTHVSLAPFL